MDNLRKIYGSGWWLWHTSEKYESQLGWLFSIYGKIENVPKHQLEKVWLHLLKLKLGIHRMMFEWNFSWWWKWDLMFLYHLYPFTYWKWGFDSDFMENSWDWTQEKWGFYTMKKHEKTVIWCWCNGIHEWWFKGWLCAT